MKEHPILFSAEMVRAILDGGKTQTRRVVKIHPDDIPSNNPEFVFQYYKCPYGKAGDSLWVRETFVIESNYNICDKYDPPFNDGRPVKHTKDEFNGDYWEQCHYRATDPEPELAYEDCSDPKCRWRPSILMPRWASRINLEIINIRVEKLQNINKKDAIAEGLNRPSISSFSNCYEAWIDNQWISNVDPKYIFSRIWDSIYKKRDYGWDKNPWVWVVKFKRLSN